MKKKVSYSRGSFGKGKSCSSPTKSQILKRIAKKQGLKVTNLKLSRCSIEDIVGLPKLNPWKRKPTAPLLFLDEVNVVSRPLQVAFMSLFLRGLNPTVKDWLKYAVKQKIHPAIRRYVQTHPKETCPTRRTWEQLSRILKASGKKRISDKEVKFFAKHEYLHALLQRGTTNA
jgi:hypothetical protein